MVFNFLVVKAELLVTYKGFIKLHLVAVYLIKEFYPAADKLDTTLEQALSLA